MVDVAYHVTLRLIAFQLHTKTMQCLQTFLPGAGDVIHQCCGIGGSENETNILGGCKHQGLTPQSKA